MSVEEQIIKVLQTSGGDLSMADLVAKVQQTATSVRPAAVKAAVLPLISRERVNMTSDRKLHLAK